MFGEVLEVLAGSQEWADLSSMCTCRDSSGRSSSWVDVLTLDALLFMEVNRAWQHLAGSLTLRVLLGVPPSRVTGRDSLAYSEPL